jgi:uncharacterized protein (DUF433 family)
MPMPPSPSRPVPPEDLEGDAIRPGDPLFGAVWVNPQRMSGAPCFYGTRVPIKSLFDYLLASHTVAEFLGDFSGVTHAQVVTVLTRAPDFLPPRGRAA